VPTAYLISESGLKGAKIGRAQVSKKHPNFIVNLGGAKARDVLKLIDLVKQKVKNV
jgi:UDP-N-acetylmuramate dehydrogenase